MTDRRSNEPEGYDEYARKPKAQRRYSDPIDASPQEPQRPRVRMHTFIGGHSKSEYLRVLFVHADPRLSSVQWKATAADAWEDFACRLRSGQP